ncbi:helix-turn-helix domain-containing protein [Microbispora sp. H10949]|nr:helix-turn-helix domain-containing protein [Microbispora sp. H10949]
MCTSLGLTQAEVAERMNVRQERVSAIERAQLIRRAAPRA